MQHRAPDLLGVVFDLPGSRINLRERNLRRRTRRAFGIKKDGARARRPLVYGEDVSVAAHQRAEPLVWLAIQPQYSALPPWAGRTSSAGSSYGCSRFVSSSTASVSEPRVLMIMTTSFASSRAPCHSKIEIMPGNMLTQAARRAATSASPTLFASSRLGKVV